MLRLEIVDRLREFPLPQNWKPSLRAHLLSRHIRTMADLCVCLHHEGEAALKIKSATIRKMVVTECHKKLEEVQSNLKSKGKRRRS